MTKLEKFLEECGDFRIDKCTMCAFVFATGGVGDECLVVKCPTFDGLFEELNKQYKEPIKFTEDEKVILRNVDAKYEWIARDNKFGGLCIFESKPIKYDYSWEVHEGSSKYFTFNHLFQQIQWEDDEPVNFREVLDNE